MAVNKKYLFSSLLVILLLLSVGTLIWGSILLVNGQSGGQYVRAGEKIESKAMHISIQEKIARDYQEAANVVKNWQQQGYDVVFTNGCFDLLHKGHILYLQEASQKGDKLIVAINADKSVSKLKGKHRPIKDEDNRSLIMAALAFVDLVVVFHEETPLELIQMITPDILVKGGDWKPHQIVGSEHVLNHGGEVLSLQFVEGYSTTALEEKIKKA